MTKFCYRGCNLALLAVTFAVHAAAVADDPPAWKPGEASKYFDERAKTWFESSNTARGKDATQTRCTSCHTLLPYILARPVLRRLEGPTTPTVYEQKALAQIQLRVERWADLDDPKLALFYDFNEDKKKESRGTEAVLNALVLALGDRNHNRKAPSDASRQAFKHLWETQVQIGKDKGSWDWLDFHLEPWEASGARYLGATFAAIAVGTAPGYYAAESADTQTHVDLLRGYLKDRLAAQNLHNRVWALWAAAKIPGVLTQEQRQSIMAEIFAKQQDDGGWSLPSLGTFKRSDGTAQETASDGYATGLILHVVQTAGAPANDSKVQKGLAWLRTHQAPSGEWRAVSVNKKRDPATHVGKFFSDAATAYAVLALSH